MRRAPGIPNLPPRVETYSGNPRNIPSSGDPGQVLILKFRNFTRPNSAVEWPAPVYALALLASAQSGFLSRSDYHGLWNFQEAKLLVRTNYSKLHAILIRNYLTTIHYSSYAISLGDPLGPAGASKTLSLCRFFDLLKGHATVIVSAAYCGASDGHILFK